MIPLRNDPARAESKRKTLQLNPNFRAPALGSCAGLPAGMLKEAVSELEKAVRLSGASSVYLAHVQPGFDSLRSDAAVPRLGARIGLLPPSTPLHSSAKVGTDNGNPNLRLSIIVWRTRNDSSENDFFSSHTGCATACARTHRPVFMGEELCSVGSREGCLRSARFQSSGGKAMPQNRGEGFANSIATSARSLSISFRKVTRHSI